MLKKKKKDSVETLWARTELENSSIVCRENQRYFTPRSLRLLVSYPASVIQGSMV